MKRSPMFRSATVLGVLLIAAGLGACNRRDDTQTAGQKVDAAVAKSEQKIDAAKASAGEAMSDAKKATTEAVNAATTAVSDTKLTMEVKSSLSDDAELKAADLSVETHDGRVALKGRVPDGAARDRATQLAASVTGVAAVDNQLTVGR